MTMATTQATVQETRKSLETLGNLIWTEGSANGDVRSLIGAIDMNLGNALKDRSLLAILRAIYCLGKLNDRFLTMAGDVDGYRCKSRQFRQEYRQYAEVARELATNLMTLVDEGVQR